ncbi:methyltransferase type 11, partial [Singulisphaera rosea]
EAYDRVETLRDPSHVRALGLDELESLFQAAGLRDVRSERYGLDVGLEPLLSASFSDPGDLDTIRQTFADDIGRDRLGVGAYRAEDGLRFAFPTVILVGRKPR